MVFKYISRSTAILLLGVYVAYFIFQLKTHASLFKPVRKETGEHDEAARVLEEEEETSRVSTVACGKVAPMITRSTNVRSLPLLYD